MLLIENQHLKKLHDQDSAVLTLVISQYSKDSKLLTYLTQIMDQGGNITAKSLSGDSALIMAGWKTNNLALIKFLVQHGADLNAANNNGDTPLIDAAYLGKTEILRYLLEQGADSRLSNKRGRTALDMAKRKKDAEAIKLLTAHAM